ELDHVSQRVALLAKRVDDTSALGRRLAGLHDVISSHLLAALDLELAGLPAGRADELLDRARHLVATELNVILCRLEGAQRP
ncbi:MAG: hypothetical protein ACRD0G_19235, partial [Acidimicrobiales bacterium]